VISLLAIVCELLMSLVAKRWLHFSISNAG
jgi:hypothetical protein